MKHILIFLKIRYTKKVLFLYWHQNSGIKYGKCSSYTQTVVSRDVRCGWQMYQWGEGGFACLYHVQFFSYFHPHKYLCGVKCGTRWKVYVEKTCRSLKNTFNTNMSFKQRLSSLINLWQNIHTHNLLKLCLSVAQELALYNEFTISDTLTFFGRIHGLTSKETQARMDFLVDFLDLPQKHSLVQNLR